MNSSEPHKKPLHIMQLIESIDQINNLVWVAEISQAVREAGGQSIVPGQIGRSEPFLRHAGSIVVDEPLNSEMRSGAESRLRHLLNDHEVTLIIAHDLDALGIARKINVQKRVPVALVVQNALPKPGFFSSLKRALEHVNRFIVPSYAMVEHLVETHKIAPEHIQIIREGIDLDKYSSTNVSSERAASLAQSWGAIEDASDLIVIPAQFADEIWRKRFLAFAKQLGEASNLSARFVVIGDDGGAGEMRQIQKRLLQQARGANIQFVGHCADLAAAVKIASMVLIFDTPNTGNYPLAVMAQALGRLVVIQGNNPAAQEFIVPDRTGYVIDDDPEDLVSLLQNLLASDEDDRNARAMASRIFLSQEFSNITMRSELAALISEMTQPSDA